MRELFRFNAPYMLHLLWIVPLLGALLFTAARRARRDLQQFSGLAPVLAPGHDAQGTVRRLLILAAVLLVVIALARPSWRSTRITVDQESRDVVFVVDVSESMRARDVVPDRLERARMAILDTLPTLEGDRVALVAFAGNAVVLCPMTRDYNFFRWAVDTMTTESTQEGGSLIGDAIRTVANEVFDPLERRSKDVILITDGEDQGSFPIDAASAAGSQGLRLVAIGIGDSTTGSRIPVAGDDGKESFLRVNGQEVWTRMDAVTLREMSLATPGGRFLNAGTGAFDLGEIYKNLLSMEDARSLGSVEITRHDDRYQPFLLAALLLLLAEGVLSDRRVSRREKR